jgi:hypothetical protein
LITTVPFRTTHLWIRYFWLLLKFSRNINNKNIIQRTIRTK